MEDLPVSLLMQQEKAKSRTGEELETFGKVASIAYLKGECKTLTQAVVDTVKTAGLGPEQVRRVVEFANTNAYLQKFASGDPHHRVISFKGGPASFPDVIRDLNDGGGGSVFDKVASASLSDYQSPPPDVEALASRNMDRFGNMDVKLASAFAVEEVEYPYSDPLRETLDLRDKIAGLYSEATGELSVLENEYLECCDELFHFVKQAALSGLTLGNVTAAMGEVTRDPEIFKLAFAMLAPRLVKNEVFRTDEAVAESLAKFASSNVVNPEHPLLGAFGEYVSTLQKLAATRQVRDEAAEQLDILSRFTVKAASTATAVAEKIRSVASHVPKAWGVATDLAARASKPVSEFATALGGETAGSIAGGAVEYSPHILAGLAAEEAYQRAKNNPAVQAGKNFVASRVPYTHQSMMRQYALQQGLNY
jgi:hypothetical protein